MSNSVTIPESLITFVVATFGTILKLLRADGDRTLQQEALMEHQEMVKQQLDNAAFNDAPSGP